MMLLPSHKTKIVATIGPACDTPELMRRMILAGMSVARLNFSHGDFQSHARAIANLRAAATSAGARLAILADLPGPKMRIGQLARESVELRAGSCLVLTSREMKGDESRISTSFPRLPQVVQPGDTLFLNDGLIQLTVHSVEGEEVICRVEVGGELRSRKGLNLPGIDLGISAFTELDRKCLQFALEHGVDAVSQSFVESAEDVLAVRRTAEAMGYRPFIIAKIERSRALSHYGEILDAADGIMIARGDLGVEIPIEEIAVVQKWLMRESNLRGKPVITATQMLESMTTSRRPTRAEATDVANAILDGTDCVMLSSESAMGEYPVEAIAMLAKIAAATEPMRPGYFVRERLKGREAASGFSGWTVPRLADCSGLPNGQDRPPPADLRGPSVGEVMALSVDRALECIPVAAVIVPSLSGTTARDIVRFRPPVWVIAVSAQESVCQKLTFSYGICPVHEAVLPEDWSVYTLSWLQDHRVEGDFALLVAGPSAAHPEANHRMEIIQLHGVEKRAG
jgi:pyruvate kinase